METFVGRYVTKKKITIDDDGRKTLDEVVKNTRKMRQLIEDLLSFSHLSRRELVKSHVDMHEIVMSICQDYKKMEDRRTIILYSKLLPNALLINHH